MIQSLNKNSLIQPFQIAMTRQDFEDFEKNAVLNFEEAVEKRTKTTLTTLEKRTKSRIFALEKRICYLRNNHRPHSTSSMQKLLYTGTNYDEVKRLCGDKVLAPYFCMGFSMLSVDTGEGFVSVNEGDVIVQEDDGSLRIEKQG